MKTTIKNLNERAMTVELRISRWTARKHDRKVSAEVAANHGAGGTGDDIGRYNKILISREALKEIDRIASRARVLHYHYTLPWHDSGPRLLSARLFQRYSEKMRPLHEAFNVECEKFIDAYPTLVEDARLRLNGLFDEDDYPSHPDIKRRFAFEFEFGVLPQSGDLRLDIGSEHLENVRSEIERRVIERFSNATKEIWTRVHDAVAHVRDRMESYDPEAKGKLHDSVIENLRELVAVLPALNIQDDPALERVRKKLEGSLCKVEIKDLRNDAKKREETRKKASSILSALSPNK